MPRVTVDGRPSDAGPDDTVLDVARASGIAIPTLCADPRLAPSGACRLCIVEVDGDAEHPVASCTTPVHDGMVVATRTPAVERTRATILRLLAARYPADAVAPTDEPFHRLLAEYGVVAGQEPVSGGDVDDTHPIIHVDLARCVSCWRCVRICEEVQGQFVWSIEGRGVEARVTAGPGGLGASDCVACGACVDTCPSGALEDRAILGAGAPERWTRTTCPYCGVGCEMQVGTRDGRIVTVVPTPTAPVNRGHLCVKGRYAHDFVDAADRVTSPMVRDGAGWRRVGWDEALAAAAGALGRVVRERGPGAVGVLGSARATNEENYLFQKVARAVLGTNNVDSCARVCHAPSAAGLAAVFGTGAATSSFDDIERTRTILVCGANATENHPIVGARIKQAKRAGANLIVIDPRRIELAEWADVHLQLRPGTTVPLLNAIASVVVEERLVDEEFLAARVDGLDKFEAHVAAYAPEQVAATCGVDAADVRRAARLYAGAKPSISFHGLGVTEHTQGTEGVMCLANLALLTGNVGKPGAGVNPLRGQNNVQGAAHMGCEPSRLPGYAPLAEHRDRVGAVWGAEIPPEPGLDAMQMIDAAATGEVAALWVVGWDILLTQPDTNTTARSLAALEALVVEDLFLNETAREYATVFLPAAGSFEKDGTFMNSERRIQRVRRAVDPPGEARPDWRIACDLAAALGRADLFAYGDPEEIWEEIQQVWQPGSGISYPRIEEAGLQWPCPADDHPGTAVLHGATFGNGETRTALRCIGYAPTPEAANDEFPFLLVTGRTLYGFNAGTMTGRSATARLRPTDRLEINPADAVRGGMEPGAAVTVVSRYGEATLPAEVTERVPPGMLFATFHDPRRRVNALTGPNRDPYTHTPEYKVTAVRIARAPA